MTPQDSDAPGRDIIVIGASAGGIEALQRLVGGLPLDLPAAVFVVVHLSPSSRGYLPHILSRAEPLQVMQARDGDPIQSGRIVVAVVGRGMGVAHPRHGRRPDDSWGIQTGGQHAHPA